MYWRKHLPPKTLTRKRLPKNCDAPRSLCFCADMQFCTKCKRDLPTTDFSPSHRGRRGQSCKKCLQANARRWEKNNQSHVRSYRRSHAKMPDPTRPEPSACEVCDQRPHVPGHKTSLHLDHDHSTGVFRGWICTRCNTTIAQSRDDALTLRRWAILARPKDNVTILNALAEYLDANGARK